MSLKDLFTFLNDCQRKHYYVKAAKFRDEYFDFTVTTGFAEARFHGLQFDHTSILYFINLNILNPKHCVYSLNLTCIKNSSKSKSCSQEQTFQNT